MNVAHKWHRRRQTNSNVYSTHERQTPFGGEGVLQYWEQIRKSVNIVRRYSEVDKMLKVAAKGTQKQIVRHIHHSVTDREEDKHLENQNQDGKTEINSGYTRRGALAIQP